MKRFMMGYGGTLIFWFGEGDHFVGLEILIHWSPYTPAMEPGKEYWIKE